uniref:Uncharacterized protein n=1 Tax=Leptobrachium leishanense TaxID=445787 RepID=A0A8C5PVD1_9ANUR
MPYPTGTSFDEPHTKPSISFMRTHSSSFVTSVSSSQVFTSSKRVDLTRSAGFLDFFASCCARRSSRILFASSLSSSEPNKSMSSSSSLASLALVSVVSSMSTGPYFPSCFFTPGRLDACFS